MIRGLRVPVHLTSRDSLRIFHLADIWAARTGHEVRLVSANDHGHSRGSAHYQGLAVDFHSSDPNGLAAVLREAGYRVLWRVPGHYGHVHVEDTGSRDDPVGTTARPVPRASRSRAAAARSGGARVSPPI